MSGHSHAKNVAGRKEKINSIKAKAFSKFSKEIIQLVRANGVDNNSQLQTIISRAKAASMPKANIDKAIQTGLGNIEDNSIECIYECIKNGVSVVVEVMTDNKNKSCAEISNIFRKFGSDLAKQGSALRNFKRLGLIYIDKTLSESDVIDQALVDSVEDIIEEDDYFVVECIPQSFFKVLASIRDNLPVNEDLSEISYCSISNNAVDEMTRKQILDMKDRLLELEYVEDVYVNID